MKHSSRIATTVALMLVSCVALSHASAQSAVTIKGSDKLKKLARISGDSAAAIARATVPGATIQEGEIEREKGRLIYSFDMKTAGKSGIDEVNVDARTGSVVAREHEDDKQEANEARAESAARKAKKPANQSS